MVDAMERVPAAEASLPGDEGSPATLGTAVTYGVAGLGAGLFYAFNNTTLPLILAHMMQSPLIIGLLSSTRSIEGVVIQPVVGAWSDRAWTRFGRRRPFMMVCIPLSAVFMALATQANTLPLLVAAVVLFSVLFNIAIDPFNALLADLFPPDSRSAVNALATVAQLVGFVALLLGAGELAARGALNWTFAIVAVGMLATFGVTVGKIREPRVLPHDDLAPHAPEHTGLRQMAGQLRGQRMAFRFLVCLFWYNFGVNAILPYLTVFATKVIGTSEQIALYLYIALIMATGVAVLPAGLIAARVGRRPVIACGLALMGATALAGLLVHTVAQTIAILIVAGIANGAISATTWPLLTELIPHDRVGVFAGLKTAFESVAIPASVLLSSLLIGWWGYRAIFVVLTVGAVTATALLATVRTEKAL